MCEFNEDARYEDPFLVKEIEHWWAASLEHDTDNSKTLDQEEYSHLYQRIVYAFNHDGDPRTDLSVFEAKMSLARDFEADSEGDGVVDVVDFKNMVFELAHTWAEDCDLDGSVSGEELAIYLGRLYDQVFGPAPTDLAGATFTK